MAGNFEEIKHDNLILAIIVRSNFKSDNIVFFSPPEFSQQVGYLPHKKCKKIPAHFHLKVERNIKYTQEVLFIKKGKIIIKLYSDEKEFVTSRELESGDILFLCSGGHGFEIIEDTEMIEVKQGPYSGREGDKEVFEE